MTSSDEAPDLSGLIELSRNPRLDLKPVLLRVQTDLFLAAPIRDRKVLKSFAALAGGLIPTVDPDTAMLVARKLGPCPDVPEAVLQCLVARGPAIAELVLSQTPQPTPSLIASARNVGADVDRVLAARAPTIEPPAPAIETPTPADAEPIEDRPIEIASIEEDTVVTDADHILAARAKPDEAKALLADPARPLGDLAPLWLHATAEQRATIRNAIEAVAALRSCPPAPRGIGQTLTAASKRKDVSGFVRALADALGLPPDFLEAAPDAVARYDLLTLGLRALDLSEAEAFFVFLSLNDAVARSVPRVFELVQMYRTTTRAAARELLISILDAPLVDRAGTGEHRPYLAPDAREPRRGAVAERVLPRAIEVMRSQRRG